MDVTPTPKMYEVMYAFTDAMCGEAPSKVETTPAAEKRRQHRATCMDVLHNLIRLAMREGVRRDREARGMATIEDHIRPEKLNKGMQERLEAAVQKVADAADV